MVITVAGMLGGLQLKEALDELDRFRKLRNHLEYGWEHAPRRRTWCRRSQPFVAFWRRGLAGSSRNGQRSLGESSLRPNSERRGAHRHRRPRARLPAGERRAGRMTPLSDPIGSPGK
jgi:hypothetical protein